MDYTYTVGRLEDEDADHLRLYFETRQDALFLLADLALALQRSDETLNEMGGLSVMCDILASY